MEQQKGLVTFTEKKSFIPQLEMTTNANIPHRLGLLNSESLTLLDHSIIRGRN